MLRIWNDADLAHIAATYDPAVNRMLPTGRPAFGHAGVDGWIVSYRAAFPDARLTVENIITRRDPVRVALRWRDRGQPCRLRRVRGGKRCTSAHSRD